MASLGAGAYERFKNKKNTESGNGDSTQNNDELRSDDVDEDPSINDNLFEFKVMRDDEYFEDLSTRRRNVIVKRVKQHFTQDTILTILDEGISTLGAHIRSNQKDKQAFGILYDTWVTMRTEYTTKDMESGDMPVEMFTKARYTRLKCPLLPEYVRKQLISVVRRFQTTTDMTISDYKIPVLLSAFVTSYVTFSI